MCQNLENQHLRRSLGMIPAAIATATAANGGGPVTVDPSSNGHPSSSSSAAAAPVHALPKTGVLVNTIQPTSTAAKVRYKAPLLFFGRVSRNDGITR